MRTKLPQTAWPQGINNHIPLQALWHGSRKVCPTGSSKGDDQALGALGRERRPLIATNALAGPRADRGPPPLLWAPKSNQNFPRCHESLWCTNHSEFKLKISYLLVLIWLTFINMKKGQSLVKSNIILWKIQSMILS